MAEAFGPLLKRTRESRGLSQSRLAEKAGFDHSYVSRVESGARQFTRDALAQVCAALAVNADEREALFHAAGFVVGNEAVVLRDQLLRDLGDVLHDRTLPVAFRDQLRATVQGMVDSVRFVRREIAA